MTDNCLAIIPARGGSKGIPKKNLQIIGGKTLFEWTLSAANGAACVTDVVVSSDDQAVLEICRVKGSNFLWRPSELATDIADSIGVVNHVLDSIPNVEEKYKFFCFLQPTSPFRYSHHIDDAFSRMLEENAEGCISVNEGDSESLKQFFCNDGYLQGISNNTFPFTARQQLPPVYKANGAIYLANIAEFKNRKSFLCQKTVPYLMDSISSVDIDTLSDLDNARTLFERKQLVNRE